MFAINRAANGDVTLTGRLDADNADRLREGLAEIEESCAVDFGKLDYISSAGIGILVATQRRLADSGHTLRLVRLSDHIGEIFQIAGLHSIFEID